MTREKFNAERTEWESRFAKAHVATVEVHDGCLTVIDWSEPGRFAYAVTYILRGNRLFVAGDLGEFVFCWSEAITPKFLASCDWQYMHGKCQASEWGRRCVEWCNETAEERLRSESVDDMDEADAARWKEVVESAENHGFDRHELERIARDLNDDTGDFELAGMVAEAGLRPAFRFVAIYAGLHMALRKGGLL